MRKRQFTGAETMVIHRFIDGFVAEVKRDRARKMLLGTYEQRIQSIQTLPDWLAPTVRVEGDAPSREARYGTLQGQIVDENDVSAATLDDAASTIGGFGAFFVSDDGNVALLIPEIGNPLLCIRSTT